MNGDFLSEFKCLHDHGTHCGLDGEPCHPETCSRYRTCGECQSYFIPASQEPCMYCIDLPADLIHAQG